MPRWPVREGPPMAPRAATRAAPLEVMVRRVSTGQSRDVTLSNGACISCVLLRSGDAPSCAAVIARLRVDPSSDTPPWAVGCLLDSCRTRRPTQAGESTSGSPREESPPSRPSCERRGRGIAPLDADRWSSATVSMKPSLLSRIGEEQKRMTTSPSSEQLCHVPCKCRTRCESCKRNPVRKQ